MPKRKLPSRPFWHKVTRAVFPKMKLEDAISPVAFVGREVLARRELNLPDELITVNEIQGCAAITSQGVDPVLIKYYQINGTHFCHMFSFHTQMEEGRVPTDREMAEFELAAEIKDIRPMKES